MAVEQYANSAFSTLASTITAGATSLNVAAGHGARFPTTGDFRIKIDNEIIIVGARSTDTLSSLTRGAENTTAASHTATAAVNHVLTRASLLALFATPTFTGQASYADGTEAAPAITNTGDLNTGVYFPAADEMGLVGGGVETLRVYARGVTIGPTSHLLPATSTFQVYREHDASHHVLADFGLILDNVAAPSDSGAMRAYVFQRTSGNAAMRAGEFQTVRSSGTGPNGTIGIEIGIHSQVAGSDPSYNTGIHLHSTHTGWLATGVRNNTAIYVFGEDGWDDLIRYYNTDNSLLFRVAGGSLSGDGAGDVITAAQMYSTGLGGTRVGILNHSGAPSGQTWAGMHYDGTNNRLQIGALTAGTSYRDVWIAPNAGTLRVGASAHTIWRAPLFASCSSGLTLTTTPTDITGATVTLDRVGRWLVSGTFAVNGVGAGDAGAIVTGALVLALSGSGAATATAGSCLWSMQATEWNTISQTWVVTVTVITTVVAKLQASKNSGSGTSTVVAGSTNITAVWMGEP